MFFGRLSPDSGRYDRLTEREADANLDVAQRITHRHRLLPLLESTPTRRALVILSYLLVAAVGFGGGFASRHSSTNLDERTPEVSRIVLPLVTHEFMDNTPFLREPPRGEGTGNLSEPIWDRLVPNGLGYFKDGHIAPQPSIPTVFHQLHCLYLIRRAYYEGSDKMQEFDFGKDRNKHVAHCLDYLRQGLTCTIDTTVEPALEQEGDFLGFGFQRQCQDFQALKNFVEDHRVFNASGFLAAGLDHGHAHLSDHGDVPTS